MFRFLLCTFLLGVAAAGCEGQSQSSNVESVESNSDAIPSQAPYSNQVPYSSQAPYPNQELQPRSSTEGGSFSESAPPSSQSPYDGITRKNADLAAEARQLEQEGLEWERQHPNGGSGNTASSPYSGTPTDLGQEIRNKINQSNNDLMERNRRHNATRDGDSAEVNGNSALQGSN